MWRLSYSILLLLFLTSCFSMPSKDSGFDSGGGGRSSSVDTKEKDRSFDPCLINSTLAVCRDSNEEAGKIQSN